MKKTYIIPSAESVYICATGCLLDGSGVKKPGGTTDPIPTIPIPTTAPYRKGDMPSY